MLFFSCFCEDFKKIEIHVVYLVEPKNVAFLFYRRIAQPSSGGTRNHRNINCELCLLSQGPGPFPGLLDLWGGGGQLVEYRASLLASHGIASLALDYLTAKIIMETGKMVDLQYFEVNFIRALITKQNLYLKFPNTTTGP